MFEIPTSRYTIDLKPAPCNAHIVAKDGTNKAYTLISADDQQFLTVSEIVDGTYSNKTTDLAQIASFVHRFLKEDKSDGSQMAYMPNKNKFTLFTHLKEIHRHIESHNSKVDQSVWIGVVHVVLLIVTLGIFSLKNHLKIENFPVGLSQIGYSFESVYYEVPPHDSLTLHQLLSLSDEDRRLAFSNGDQLGDEDVQEMQAKFKKVLVAVPHLLQFFTLVDLYDETFTLLDKTPEELSEITIDTLPRGGNAIFLLHHLLNKEAPIKPVIDLDSFYPNLHPQLKEAEIAEEDQRSSLDSPTTPKTSYRDIPLNFLWRMTPEQFNQYWNETIPHEWQSPKLQPEHIALPYFPWESKKCVIEKAVQKEIAFQESEASKHGFVDPPSENQGVYGYGLLTGLFRFETPEDREEVRRCIAALSFAVQQGLPDEFFRYLPTEHIQQIDWENLEQHQIYRYISFCPQVSFAGFPLSKVKEFLLDDKFKMYISTHPRVLTVEMIRQIGSDWFFANPEAISTVFSPSGELQPLKEQFYKVLDLSYEQKMAVFQNVRSACLSAYFSVSDWEQFDLSRIAQDEEMKNIWLRSITRASKVLSGLSQDKLREVLEWAKTNLNAEEITLLVNRLPYDRLSEEDCFYLIEHAKNNLVGENFYYYVRSIPVHRLSEQSLVELIEWGKNKLENKRLIDLFLWLYHFKLPEQTSIDFIEYAKNKFEVRDFLLLAKSVKLDRLPEETLMPIIELAKENLKGKDFLDIAKGFPLTKLPEQTSIDLIEWAKANLDKKYIPELLTIIPFSQLPCQTSIDVIQWAKGNFKDVHKGILRLIHFDNFPADKAIAVLSWGKGNFSPEEFSFFIPTLDEFSTREFSSALIIWGNNNLQAKDFNLMTIHLSRNYVSSILNPTNE